ncbi:hypothetical protein [Alicyclobacillus sp. ALC3]|uniref:hypothetical protein n=1 Tax=Alicyclobacillus sp. ALC3 TaxID=2796143 RepID=UPI002377F6BA|nr:hypothetical protein [Alicyclobacillus sp. ALC3]WDL97254.1 hypothetical protein JC200_00360 [Alicyclobacillus sp. ALC3]
MKDILWVLLGVVIGVGGFWIITYKPGSDVFKPTSPTNVSLMFEQAVNNNSLYSVRELMTPQTKDSFTRNELKAVRKYVKAGTKEESTGTGYSTYEVVTFGSKNIPITLWLAPPLTATKSPLWLIQRITEGATVTSPPK